MTNLSWSGSPRAHLSESRDRNGLDLFRRHGRLCVYGGLCGTFLLDFNEGPAGGSVSCLDLGCGGEPPDDYVTLMRIELDAVAPPAGLLGGDQCGTAASEGIEHDAAALGAVENRVGG